MRHNNNSIQNAGSAVVLLLLALSVLVLGYRVERSEFSDVLFSFVPFFALFYWIYRFKSQWFTPWFIIGGGLVLRILLLPSLPHLSDDCYRFLWDGHLANHGIHPFSYTPRYVLDHLQVPGIDQHWFDLLNSQRYYSVYPPVDQLIFRWADWVAGGSLERGILALKVVILLGEVMTLTALYRYLKQIIPHQVQKGLILYAFNPLIIIETVGNCHFEGMMMGFLVVGMLCLQHNRTILAGGFWAIAVATKLLPVLFLPVACAWLGIPRAKVFLGAFAVFLGLLFTPLFDLVVLTNMAASVRLYFQQFEFNASVYYVFSYLSPYITGWYEGRLISPYLAFLTVILTVITAWLLWKKPVKNLFDLQKSLFWVSFIYLINSTTVHPWYVIVPFFLSIGTGYQFPVAWAFSVICSYSHYIGGRLEEHFIWITAEYVFVFGVLMIEIKQGNMDRFPPLSDLLGLWQRRIEQIVKAKNRLFMIADGASKNI